MHKDQWTTLALPEGQLCPSFRRQNIQIFRVERTGEGKEGMNSVSYFFRKEEKRCIVSTAQGPVTLIFV